MHLESRLRVAFAIVAAFLLIAGVVAILLVHRLNRILRDVNACQFRLELLADTQNALHRPDGRLADDMARLRDLQSWATSEQERRLIAETTRALAEAGDVRRADQLLDTLAAYYRTATRAAHDRLNIIYRRAVIAVIIVMAEAIALLIVIMALIRSWLVRPVEQFQKTVTRILQEGPLPEIENLDGEWKQAATSINQLLATSKAQQERLERTERSAHIGEAVAFICRNVAESLAAIRTLAQYEQNAPRTSADSQAAFAHIDKLAGRLERWVRDAINSTRALELTLGNHALETVVGDALALLEPLLEEKAIRPTVKLPNNLPPGRLDRVLFQQALVAVLTNAIEATPDGGCITISATQHNGAITLAVADYGQGMSTEQCLRARQAFFTTKPGAAGLGLTIAEKIIRQHQGVLEIESTPKKGTTVKITIPAGVTAKGQTATA